VFSTRFGLSLSKASLSVQRSRRKEGLRQAQPEPGWGVLLFLLIVAFLALPALAQAFPPLTGRVVDTANLLSPDQEAALTAKLEGLERSSGRQLVVATIPDLQGYPIEDYGYQLGRSWGIGQKGQNNGVILLVAPNDRKMRIEVGYGLEPYLTDALSSVIVREQMRPRFQQGDFAGGIQAGVDAIIAQLQLPEDQAQARQGQILAAERAQQSGRRTNGGGPPIGLIFWLMVAGFVFLSMRRGRGRKSRGMFGSRRYRRGGDGNWPIWLWVASEVAANASRSRGGFGGGGFGGGGGGWGGGGGFSGGGGSFGGGGDSGDW